MFSCCCPSDLNGAIVERISDEQKVISCVSHDLSVQNVTYVSDVEGQWEYFCNFVEHSKGLSFHIEADPQARRSAEYLELLLEEGWHFVHGGDACDKGPGTLRLLEALVRLKRKCPGRVHLLLGNGDLNKLGWASHLATDDIGKSKDVPASLWAQEPPTKAPPEEEFEGRRAELAHIKGVATEDITDQDVQQSYVDCLKPGGWLREYLQRAQLGVLLGETLFLDGQVIAIGQQGEEGGDGAGAELRAPTEEQSQQLQNWIASLNQWSRTKLLELDTKKPMWDPPPAIGSSQ